MHNRFQILLRGVLVIAKKSRGSHIFMFYWFLITKFFDVFWGVHKVSPINLPSPSHVHFWSDFGDLVLSQFGKILQIANSAFLPFPFFLSFSSFYSLVRLELVLRALCCTVSVSQVQAGCWCCWQLKRCSKPQNLLPLHCLIVWAESWFFFRPKDAEINE